MTCHALLLATLLTSQVAMEPESAPDPLGAMEVFSCEFDPPVDLNFDRWPDDWTRRRDVDHPAYLPVAIVEDAEGGDRRLRIELDGGAAAIYSPPISVSRSFSYVLEARLRTEGIQHDVAYYSLTFYNAQHDPRRTYYSRHFHLTDDWISIQIGPVHPEYEDVEVAVIGLHLRPTTDFDLSGAAEFDSIRLSRRPRMTLSSSSAHNVFRDHEIVEFTCEFSGVTASNPHIAFELIDISSGENQLRLTDGEERIVVQDTAQATDVSASDAGLARDVYSGTVTWRPPDVRHGCYRLRVTMQGDHDDDTPLHERTTMFAVVSDARTPLAGEYGWTLPQGDDPLELSEMVDLLGQVGVSWVKFPVWYTPDDQRRADQLAWFAERLSAQNINMVGVLDQPPEGLREQFPGEGHSLAANIFQEPELWHPVLNPVTTRLSLKVRWWQLGGDNDTSFMAYPNLADKIYEIKDNLERFGQEIQIGLGWDWMYQTPGAEDAPWSFLSFTTDLPLTSAELSRYLSTSESLADRWVVLEPLPRDEYSTGQRARDLVQRMLAAKIAEAEAVFVPDPFDPRSGLMNPDGTPGELLIPWRTAALQLTDSKYLGSIELPGGSSNHMFTRGNQAMMIIWNDEPTTETIYLGESIEQIDLWGHSVTPERTESGQVIHVGPLPTFVTGLNRQIAELRMSCQFDRQQLASIFSRPQAIGLTFRNPFNQGISGKTILAIPDDWGKPLEMPFESHGEETAFTSYQIKLDSDASSGLRTVRIDFHVNADHNYQFSVYRTLEIGLGDILLDHALLVGQDGQLIVEQQLVNRSNEFISFNCYLFAPGRRRMRQQVIDLGQGQRKLTFILPDGNDLDGQTIWLRAEEIGGERVLNRRIDIEM